MSLSIEKKLNYLEYPSSSGEGILQTITLAITIQKKRQDFISDRNTWFCLSFAIIEHNIGRSVYDQWFGTKIGCESQDIFKWLFIHGFEEILPEPVTVNNLPNYLVSWNYDKDIFYVFMVPKRIGRQNITIQEFFDSYLEILENNFQKQLKGNTYQPVR